MVLEIRILYQLGLWGCGLEIQVVEPIGGFPKVR